MFIKVRWQEIVLRASEYLLTRCERFLRREEIRLKALAELQPNVASFIWMKQNVFVWIIVLGCRMMLNNAKCETFNLFVTQISRSLSVISFQ